MTVNWQFSAFFPCCQRHANHEKNTAKDSREQRYQNKANSCAKDWVLTTGISLVKASLSRQWMCCLTAPPYCFFFAWWTLVALRSIKCERQTMQKYLKGNTFIVSPTSWCKNGDFPSHKIEAHCAVLALQGGGRAPAKQFENSYDQ